MSLSAAVLLAGLAAAVSPQPPQSPRTQPVKEEPAGERAERGERGERGDKPAADRPEFQRFRERMRKHIEERVERARRVTTQLEEALKLLESGGEPAEIRQTLEGVPDYRPWQRPRGGHDGAGGGGSPAGGAGGPPPGGPPGGPGVPPSGDQPRREPAIGRQAGPGFGGGEGLIGLEREPVRPLTPDERREVVVLIRERSPELADQFESLRGRGAELYERTIDSLAPRVRMYRDARDRGDEEMAKLRFDDLRHTVELFRTAMALKGAGDDRERRAKAQDEMRDVLGRQFDTRIAIREREIEQFMRRVESMRKEIEKLKGQKDDIIKIWDFGQRRERGEQPPRRGEKDEPPPRRPDGN